MDQAKVQQAEQQVEQALAQLPPEQKSKIQQALQALKQAYQAQK